MLRLFLLTAIFRLCAGEMQARSAPASAPQGPTTPRAPEAIPRPVRRVAFRSEAAPQKSTAPQAAPVTPARERRAALEVQPSPNPRRLPPWTAPRPAPDAEPARGLVLQPTPFTPYDAYLGTVRAVIARLDTRSASMLVACALMREGRSFHYRMTDPYRAAPPAVTEARRAGDCKSKALWLYDHLGDSGAYYTIGKLQRGASTSHAWVYWRHDGRWWILDPTDRATPIAADSVSSSRYVPYYSYSPSGTFRHPATSLMLAMGNGIPAATSAVAVRARFEGGSARAPSR